LSRSLPLDMTQGVKALGSAVVLDGQWCFGNSEMILWKVKSDFTYRQLQKLIILYTYYCKFIFSIQCYINWLTYIYILTLI